MATLLLAVILVSGFIYVNLSLSTRYRYKRSNGWDAYFCGCMGNCLFSLAAFLPSLLTSVVGFAGFPMR
jgi:hypothetical protein